MFLIGSRVLRNEVRRCAPVIIFLARVSMRGHSLQKNGGTSIIQKAKLKGDVGMTSY